MVRTILVILLVFSMIRCTQITKENNQSGPEDLDAETIGDILNSTNWDTTNKILKFEFYPKDMIIDLPHNGELEIFKSSFIDAKGNPFYDKVQISLNPIVNSVEIMKLMTNVKISNMEQVKYLFTYNVTAKNGERIYMDKYAYPRLRFHPSEDLSNAFYGYYDSSLLKWVLPVHKSTKKNTTSADSFSYSYKVVDHINNDETYYVDTSGNIILPKEITKTELLSYYINLKYNGLYYIGKHNGSYNQHIPINVSLDEYLDFSEEVVHMYLMMEDKGYKYYHKADRSGQNVFSFDYPLIVSGIILDTAKNHKLFAYVIKDGKYYYYYDGNLLLNNKNSLKIKLSQIDELALVNVLKNLDVSEK